MVMVSLTSRYCFPCACLFAALGIHFCENIHYSRKRKNTSANKYFKAFKKSISFPKFNRCVNLLFISPNDLVIWEISGFADEKWMSKKIHLSS